MSTAAIEIEHVTKSYHTAAGSNSAIDDVSLTLLQREFTSLMGPSGSGKTTLLNLMAGIDTPDRGAVRINGIHLGDLGDRELAALRLRAIGLVFQAFNLIPAFTVEENVEWPLEFQGMRRPEVRRRVAESLERTGVGHCARRYPAELSGGEQQRVAIARAVATKPAILLADEPTGNLDSHTGEAVLDLLRDLNRSEGVTIVMVTHDVFAATYGHRTLEIRDGRIVRDLRAPATASLSLVQMPDR